MGYFILCLSFCGVSTNQILSSAILQRNSKLIKRLPMKHLAIITTTTTTCSRMQNTFFQSFFLLMCFSFFSGKSSTYFLRQHKSWKFSFQTLVENKNNNNYSNNNNNYSNNKNANKKKNWLGFASPFGNFGIKTIYPDYFKPKNTYLKLV